MKRVLTTCISCVVPHEKNNFRPYFLRSAGVVAIALVIVGAGIGTTAYRITLSQSDFLASVLPGVLVSLANTDRSGLALNSLTPNARLADAARLKAEDMAKNGYFAHQSPDGKTPWYWFAQAGYSFVYAGENLAINFDDSSAVNDAWMNSPGHRANILNGSYTEIGIATAKGQYQGRETTFVVQLFGSPARTRATTTKAPVTIATSTIKSASTTEDFVAVKSAEAGPAEVVAKKNTVSGCDSPLTNCLTVSIVSPTQILKIVYKVVVLILLSTLGIIFVRRHPQQRRHIIIILSLLVLVAVVFWLATSPLFVSKLQIL